ncbi:MAG: hypothetical protein ACU85V_07105, partial [Gammaproteobacteria bacterium]
LYQGEIVGEVAFDRLIAATDDAGERYKLATLLQLETETKARLRPALLERGLSIVEDPASRETGEGFAAAMLGQDWSGMMATLEEGLVPYVARYRAIAEAAPPDGREVAEMMVVHETSLLNFARLEQAGDPASLDDVVKQLAFPLTRP